jgi:mono/diheme cytochrome c family protein
MRVSTVVGGFVAAACVIGFAATGALAQDAKAIYAKDCAKCHGDSGAGDGPQAAKLKDKPANWASGGLKDYDDAKLADVIKKGGRAVGKSAAMPASPKLSDADVQGLVAYVKTLKK